MEELLQKYEEVFREELGTVKSMKATLTLKDSLPKFFQPRTVPFAIKDAIAKEIERLEAAGVLEKAEFSQWATHIVPVPKKDGSFRLCGDYKVTINPGIGSRSAPTIQTRGDLCFTGWGSVLCQARLVPSLPAVAC